MPATGLHCNDIRGATITRRSQRQGHAARSGAAAGAIEGRRDRPPHQGDRRADDSSLAVFVLDFDSELLFVGDAGTTEPSRPSRRVGVEWTNQYKPLPWLGVDLDLAYTRARFTDSDPAGNFIPGAPAWVASGGVTLRRRDRLVRRAARPLFRPAAADRGRQRSFAGIADLQCPRRLSLRQWHASCSSTC